MGIAEEISKNWQDRPSFKTEPKLLLCANTVKPMHGVVPRVILGKEWWDKTRQEAYESTGFHCLACGVAKWDAKEHKWLEGHEVYHVNYRRGRMTYLRTVPLCHYCHCYIHSGRLKSLTQQGKTSKGKYNAVILHGSQVLEAVGIRKRRPRFRKLAAWEDWRLCLDGKEYPPIYKDYQAWFAAFNQGEVGED